MLQVGGVITALFVMLKAFAVSNYSLTTTGALITTAPLTVLLGSLASYLYLLLAVMAFGLPVWVVLHAGELNRYFLGVCVALWVVTLLLLPVPNRGSAGAFLRDFTYAGICAVVLWTLSRALTRARARRGPGFLGAVSRAWFIGVGLGLLVVPTMDRPWVPAEVLVLRQASVPSDMHLKDGRLPLSKYPVVYVLADSGEWTSALDANTRLLLRIPSSNIAARAVCHQPSQLPGTGTLWQRLRGQSYASPNTLCSKMVDDPTRRLDVLVVPPAK